MPLAAGVGAYQHAIGPQELFVRFRGTSQWQFVGTAVQAPEPELTPNFLEVFNDYGGRLTPFNLVYDGETGLVPIVVNRMDLQVCRSLRDMAGTAGNLNAFGVDSMLERGSLVFGIYDFELALKNMFYGTINAVPGDVPGRKYHSAVLGAYKESTVGTRVLECAMVFRVNNIFLGPDTGFKMYTEDLVAGDFANMTHN